MREGIDYQKWMHPRAKEILGSYGRSIASSKSWYGDQFPDHVVIFNVSVISESGEHLWAGDLDLSLDLDACCQMAEEFGPLAFLTEGYGTSMQHDHDFPRGDGFGDEAEADFWAEMLHCFVFRPDRLAEARARIARKSHEQAEHHARWLQRLKIAEEEKAEREAQRAAIERWNSGADHRMKRAEATPEDILYS